MTDQDPGYWCFTRRQLNLLCAGLDQHAAVIVLQALDSTHARELGMHILPSHRATRELPLIGGGPDP